MPPKSTAKELEAVLSRLGANMVQSSESPLFFIHLVGFLSGSDEKSNFMICNFKLPFSFLSDFYPWLPKN